MEPDVHAFFNEITAACLQPFVESRKQRWKKRVADLRERVAATAAEKAAQAQSATDQRGPMTEGRSQIKTEDGGPSLFSEFSRTVRNDPVGRLMRFVQNPPLFRTGGVSSTRPAMPAKVFPRIGR